MICPKCSEMNPDNARFCHGCGYPFEAAAPQPRHMQPEQDESRFAPFDGEPRFNKKEARSPDEYFFTPKQYGETQPYTGADRQSFDARREAPAQVRPRRRSNTPYVVTSLLTALLAVLNFVFPFLTWLGYRFTLGEYQIAQDKVSLFDFLRSFIENADLLKFLFGNGTDYGFAQFMPQALAEKYTFARIGAMIIAGIFAIALLLYLIFILLTLFRVRSAPGMGISAALITILGNVGFLFSVNKISEFVKQFSVFNMNLFQINLTSTAYLSIGLSVLIILLCVVFAALDRRKKRR